MSKNLSLVIYFVSFFPESLIAFGLQNQIHSNMCTKTSVITVLLFLLLEKYYAGESITPESPPSFVCPFCSQLGFTETLLQEHVAKTHEDVHKEVVSII